MRRTSPPILLLLASALAGTGCLGTSPSPDLHADLDDIKTQILLLQREHAALQDRLDEQAGDVRAALEQGGEDGRVGQADLIARVDSMTMEMEVLGQKLEDTNFRLSSLSTEIQTARSLWKSPGAAGTAGAASGGVAPDPYVFPTPPGGRTADPVPGGAPPEEIFNTAYADFTKGNYPLAILGFQEYLERFPDSAFADDALYWVGESYYSQGKYDDAIEAFGELTQRYPQGDKAPGAHLKRGFALLEINQTAQGVMQLNALMETYPHTDEARLARERLRSLGLR